MSDSSQDAETWRSPPPPPLGVHAVHVWRIQLDDRDTSALWPVLSAEEQARARRFHQERHRRQYVIAHGTLRRILGEYAGLAPSELAFETGEFGKPSLLNHSGPQRLEFNLSHSGDLALVAVARGGLVGVDVERWNGDVEHLDVAEHFFSPGEQRALRALAGSRELLTAGFFAAWSRKEAYLKASGRGVTGGLHHFDVSLAPDEPARLLGDRHDHAATERWTMTSLEPAAGYSAALVVATPLDEILLFDAVTAV
jgi:4'-phosphopantetheinyl transferase